MKTRNRQLLLGLSVFLLGSLAFSIITYSYTHKHLVNDIDQHLWMAAYAANELLGPNFHHRGMNEDSVTDEKDFQVSMILTDFVREVDIEYVYSMIMVEDEIIFATSSATVEEMENDAYEKAYYMLYPEADDSLKTVFATKQTGYSEYTDRWGEFRSVFIPFTATDGRDYVVGADVSMSEVNAIARQSGLVALLASFGLGLIGFPLIYFYSQSVRREAHIEIERLYRCPLTGLPNRSRLLEDLKTSDYANVSVINIDKFREITSLYGPAIGDEVLKQFSLRLSRIDTSAVKNFRCYRLNADEFATLVDGKHDPKLLQQELAKLYDHLIKHPYQAGSKRIKLRIRLGAASASEDAFVLADMALREARDANRSMVIYDNELHLPETYRASFEQTQRFRRALDEKRFVPYYQAILNTTTGEIDKYECLSRMVDNHNKVVGLPDEFLPLAYRSRLYHSFSKLMLEKIFDSVETNQHTVSINITVSDINYEPTTQYIFQRLSNSKVAQQVEFEIMENENIDNLSQMVRFIQKVKAYGCKIGLDDLGKDYSNVDRLIALPVDFVKIDGNIIMHLANDREAQDIARMIISLAYKRQIKTVAEYCCDSKVSEVARRLGVDYLQGFYIGEPKANISDFQKANDKKTSNPETYYRDMNN